MIDSRDIEYWRKRAEPGSPIATLITRYDVLAAETWRPESERALFLEGFRSAIGSLAVSLPNDSFISYDDFAYAPKDDQP